MIGTRGLEYAYRGAAQLDHRYYKRGPSPVALKCIFVIKYGIKGREKSLYQPYIFARVVEDFKNYIAKNEERSMTNLKKVSRGESAGPTRK